MVSKAVGYSSPSFTLDRHGRVVIEMRAAAAARFDERFKHRSKTIEAQQAPGGNRGGSAPLRSDSVRRAAWAK
jgi:hypothetical protein